MNELRLEGSRKLMPVKTHPSSNHLERMKMVKGKRRKRKASMLKDKRLRYGLLIAGFVAILLFTTSISFSAFNPYFTLNYGTSLSYQGAADGGSIFPGETVDSEEFNTQGWNLYVNMYGDYEDVSASTCKLIHTASGTELVSGVYGTYPDPNAEDYKSGYFTVNINSAYRGTSEYHFEIEGVINIVSITFEIVGMQDAVLPPPSQTDITPPLIVIAEPIDGVRVSGTTTISFTATDAHAILATRILIDGVEIATTLSYDWDTTGLANGTYVIRCEAMDYSDNIGYQEISVVIGGDGDVTIPDAPEFITKPDDAITMLSSENKTLSWLISDDNPNIYKIYQNGSLIDSGVATLEEFPIDIELTTPDAGVYSYEVEFSDVDGNTISHTVIVTVEATGWMEDPIIVIAIVIGALLLVGGGGTTVARNR